MVFVGVKLDTTVSLLVWKFRGFVLAILICT